MKYKHICNAQNEPICTLQHSPALKGYKGISISLLAAADTYRLCYNAVRQEDTTTHTTLFPACNKHIWCCVAVMSEP